MKNFSDRLEQAIKQSRIPKGNLARHMEVALSTVSRWLSGTMPTADKVLQMADFLGVDAKWLMNGETPNESDAACMLREEPVIYRTTPSANPSDAAAYIKLLERILPTLGISELMETLDTLNASKPHGWESLSSQAIALLRQKLPNPPTP